MESQQPGTPFRSPHDLYLRQVMQHAIVVRELAQTFLPAEVLSLLNLDSLQLAAESFVSEALEEFFADVVYTCQMR
ncbi:MAG: Rpn family recombination-promoting nuclease/putative transposase, partial [Saprospiraceae bacterium]|nr:Rpn family recombination-promoting nuclease/putative transposase [Saprospiraceae bacterium]MDW8484497.1 Rpn family recombination-promoting nuclease/putative transposase [Saprospiraceae bacterium]